MSSTAAVPKLESIPDTAPAEREYFIDHIRVLLTVLVVLHHAGQAYGPTGGRWPIFHAEKFALLGPFFHVNASFFMGFFFLLAGYFMPPAYERKGAARFLKERLQRLGIPVVIFVAAVFPFVHHVEWAHLWFLGHLIVYAVAYAAYRRLWSTRPITAGMRNFPASRKIIVYVAMLALVSAAVRIWYPIDRWMNVGVPAELAHFPQYFSLFLFGIVAYRYQWLARIPARTGRTWLAVGLTAIILRFAYALNGFRFLRGSIWADLTWCLWEALVCTGMCIGLLYWFRRNLEGSSPVAQFAARHAYGVYVLHLPILVGVQFAVERAPLGPLTLTILTGSVTLVVSYAIASALRRIPYAQAVL